MTERGFVTVDVFLNLNDYSHSRHQTNIKELAATKADCVVASHCLGLSSYCIYTALSSVWYFKCFKTESFKTFHSVSKSFFYIYYHLSILFGMLLQSAFLLGFFFNWTHHNASWDCSPCKLYMTFIIILLIFWNQMEAWIWCLQCGLRKAAHWFGTHVELELTTLISFKFSFQSVRRLFGKLAACVNRDKYNTQHLL